MGPDGLQTVIYIVLGFTWIIRVDEDYQNNKDTLSDYEIKKIKTMNRVHFTVGILYILLGVSRYYKYKKEIKESNGTIGFDLGTS